jgi:hypothetical protein
MVNNLAKVSKYLLIFNEFIIYYLSAHKPSQGFFPTF